MLESKNDILYQSRASGLGQLIRIVAFQYKHYCHEIRVMFDDFGGYPEPKVISENFPEFFDRTITTTVFTGMAIEAFLYDFSVVNVSKTYADKVENRTLDDEFEDIVNKVIGDDASEFQEIKQRLTSLKLSRNHFVHNKSTQMGKYNTKSVDWLTPNMCMNLLIDVMTFFELHKPNYLLSSYTRKTLEEVKAQEDAFLTGS
ncbi:hypothetical protein L4D09_12730 [Photobacterium makurazakiensis]|uniref:hypothetical protein n=1 Tax=Photobacterium makurazakiensis TaxID=2910234 RepID=UPI003D1467FB